MRLLVVLTFSAGLIATIAGLLSPATVEGQAAAAPCDWGQEFNRTLGGLGENTADWSVDEIEPFRGRTYIGMTYPETVTARISPELPCRKVADTILHEWVHLQQIRAYGGWWPETHRALGRDDIGQWRNEIVAECGAMLLGARDPYMIAERQEEYGVACTDRDLSDARFLISFDQPLTP